MAESVVQICNDALTYVGASLILSLSDNSREAQLCDANYERARDFVCRHHVWNCVNKRTTISPEVTTPEYGWEYAFNLPVDCLRLVSVGEDPVGYDYEWQVEGRQILSNEAEIKITYIKKETDTTKFDSMLDQAIALYLAWRICFALTQNTTLKNAVWMDYKDHLTQARSVDSKENPAQQLEANLFTDSRTQYPRGAKRQDR